MRVAQEVSYSFGFIRYSGKSTFRIQIMADMHEEGKRRYIPAV